MANETGAPYDLYSEAAVLRQSRDLYPISIPVDKVPLIFKVFRAGCSDDGLLGSHFV